MQWFYMIRAEPSRHGLADEKLILDMALRREIGPEDLVWNRESGTEWVRAGSVSGLLPAAAPAPVEPPPVAAAPLEPVTVAQGASQSSHLPRWLWVAVAAGVLLVTLVLVLLRRS